MPGNFKNEDLRIIKTHKSLLEAFPKLLQRNSFARITVNDLCEEAQLSRATFYAHFLDKYDLLEYWLGVIKPEINNGSHNFSELEKSVNRFVEENKKIIINLLSDANNETSDILHKFIFSLMNTPKEYCKDGKPGSRYTIFSNFCAGGILRLLAWQIENRFPAELPLMNDYFYQILMKLYAQFESTEGVSKNE